MSRTYHQFCPIAYSLDLLGDRWTILVIRELLFGPRRYTDLQRGLPTMASNLLARRLKEMEDNQLIRQRKLPPPASTTVYELTEYGMTTRPIVDSLMRWGIHRVVTGNYQEDHLSIVATVNAISGIFHKRLTENVTFVCELQLEDEVYSLIIQNQKLQIEPGDAQKEADLIVWGIPKTVLGWLVGAISTEETIASETLKIIKGDIAKLERFASFFQLPLSLEANPGVT